MASTNGRVAGAAHDCIASFDAIAQFNTPESKSSETATEWSRNEDGRSRFQIWMSNLGAAHPVLDRRSADYRLREAPEVVDRIVELLEELTEINSEVLEIVSGERSNRHFSEEDSDTESSSPGSGQDELSELFLSTGDVLTSLFKVSMLVKKATTRDRYARAANAKDKPYLVEFDIRHVADKYPKARDQPWLLERLGTAITQRRQFLRYCRNHKNRIAHVSSPDTALLGQNEDAPKPLYHDGELGLPAHNVHVASSAKTPMTRPTLSPTAASTLQPDKIVREDLQDLDDNDDAVSQSTSVAYSQATAEKSGQLRVVRLQDLSHNHEPFECPYCYSIVQAKRQHSWRKHVLSDLRAYVCMFEDCDSGLFEDKAAWARHDAEEHRRQWDCQHCRNTDRPFSSSQGLHEHLRSLHAGHELPPEVLSQVVQASSRPLNEIAPDCPLCDFDIEVNRQADRTGQAIPPGSQAVIPLAELQKHLALHQEQLALFAIPPAVERGVESESRRGKSQVGPDEQIKMMADWQDHLSELDTADNLEQLSDRESSVDSAGDFEESYPSPPTEPHQGENAPVELPVTETAVYEPLDLDSPNIVPGDIVYIRRQTGKQLHYTKAVYLGDPGGGQRTAATNHGARPAIENTPAIRNGGFGALQVEAVTNQPLSIARRHLAASQLRMRDVEPDQLSQSEWVRFLAMPEDERQRWISQFQRRRRESAESIGSSSHVARIWDTKNDVKVSLSELVRKGNVTEHESVEAESIRAYVAIQDSETLSKSRFYLKHATLPPEIKSPFITRMNKLATGDELLHGYDEMMVQNACSAFLKFETQIMGHSVRVEELVRMFYASAVTAAPGPKKRSKKDEHLSDNARTAGIKRHAALLTDVLTGVVDEASEKIFPERDIVSAQLREEHSAMLSRANSADKKDVSSTHRDQLKEAELSPQFLEAMKSRLAVVIEGEDTAVTLPKLGAHLMKQTCSSFLFRLRSTYPADRAIPLETILGEFLACAETEIRHDKADSARESRSVAAERLVALLLDLLITINAGLEREGLNAVLTRKHGQITAILMEERFRYLTQASEIEDRLFRVSERSKPEFDIHFFTEQSRRAHDKRYGEMMTGGEYEPSDLDDPSEPKYCYCLRGSHGVMVACDGPNCRRKWFHLSCTDLERPLNNYKTWFCIFCQPPVSKTAEDTPGAAAAAIVDEGDTEPGPDETQDAGVAAKERPPRGMVCDNCKFVWRSASAMELRDCPNCGSYSVFAESPPRTTSPEAMDADLRPDATGEEAIGQYFSERTDKFMSLYRRETLAEPKSELPRDDLPGPRSHLHTSPANSSHLEESPLPLPKNPLTDFGTPDNTSDVSALVVDPDLRLVRWTIMYLRNTMHVFHRSQSHNSDHRSITGNSDIREVYDQICSISRTLEKLLQDNDPQGQGLHPEWELKLQRFGRSLSTLCLSMNITLEDLNNALGSSEADKWEEVVRRMEDDEKVGCLKRLELYRMFIAVLLTLAEGSTDEYLLTSKLQLDDNISSLLRLQDPDGLQARHKGEAATIAAEDLVIGSPDFGASPNTTGDESTLVTASDLLAVRELRQTVDQIEYANHILSQAYSKSNGGFAGGEEIEYLKRRLHRLGDGLQKLLKDRSDDAEYLVKLKSMHGISSALCSSIQNTLEDLLIAVKSGDARQWSHTLRMMAEVENVRLLARLRDYEELVVDFNIVYGAAGLRADLWSDPHERVRTLLTAQESNTLQVTERNLHRREIWPVEWKPQPALQDRQVEDKQAGGSSDEPLKVESPLASPKDPSLDTGASNTTGDRLTPSAESELPTVLQIKRTVEQLGFAQYRLLDESNCKPDGIFLGNQEIRNFYNDCLRTNDTLKRLLPRQSDDTERRVKLTSFKSIIFTLCSSIRNTLEDVLIALASNDTTQWTETMRMMQDVELVGASQRLKLYQDVLVNLTKARDRDSDYWLKGLAADVLELLGSQDNNSSQVARRNSHRSVIWPPHLNYPLVKKKQTEGGLEGSRKSSNHEEEEEEETAVLEPPTSASHDRGREIEGDHEATSAGSADRSPELRVIAPSPPSSIIGEFSWIPRARPNAGSSEEENEDEEEAIVSDANLRELRVSAPSPLPPSSSARENEATIAHSGGPAASRGPYAAGSPEHEGAEGSITSEDRPSAYRDDRDQESQEKPADMSTSQGPEHPRQPEPYPRPAPQGSDWTPKKLADLMLQRDDEEPSSTPKQTAASALSEISDSESERARERRQMLNPAHAMGMRFAPAIRRTYGRTTVTQYHYPDSPPVVISDISEKSVDPTPATQHAYPARQAVPTMSGLDRAQPSQPIASAGHRTDMPGSSLKEALSFKPASESSSSSESGDSEEEERRRYARMLRRREDRSRPPMAPREPEEEQRYAPRRQRGRDEARSRTRRELEGRVMQPTTFGLEHRDEEVEPSQATILKSGKRAQQTRDLRREQMPPRTRSESPSITITRDGTTFKIPTKTTLQIRQTEKGETWVIGSGSSPRDDSGYGGSSQGSRSFVGRRSGSEHGASRRYTKTEDDGYEPGSDVAG